MWFFYMHSIMSSAHIYCLLVYMYVNLHGAETIHAPSCFFCSTIFLVLAVVAVFQSVFSLLYRSLVDFAAAVWYTLHVHSMFQISEYCGLNHAKLKDRYMASKCSCEHRYSYVSVGLRFALLPIADCFFVVSVRVSVLSLASNCHVFSRTGTSVGTPGLQLHKRYCTKVRNNITVTNII